jgi:hypothetical protein
VTHRGERITTSQLYRRCAILLERGQLPRQDRYDRTYTVAAIVLYGDPRREYEPALDLPLRFYRSVYGSGPYQRDRAVVTLRRAARTLAGGS